LVTQNEAGRTNHGLQFTGVSSFRYTCILARIVLERVDHIFDSKLTTSRLKSKKSRVC